MLLRLLKKDARTQSILLSIHCSNYWRRNGLETFASETVQQSQYPGSSLAIVDLCPCLKMMVWSAIEDCEYIPGVGRSLTLEYIQAFHYRWLEKETRYDSIYVNAKVDPRLLRIEKSLLLCNTDTMPCSHGCVALSGIDTVGHMKR